MKKLCFYTSFNKAYASQALMLLASIRQQYGTAVDVVALMVDQLSELDRAYLAGFDRILLAEELNIPKFKTWLFGLTIVEAATAVKPFGLCRLLEEYDQVTYLDPDTVLYSPLDEIVHSTEAWDITLTPHQTVPQHEAWIVNSTELESLRFGVYNLGFISVRSTPQGRDIAAWWRDRCYNHCIDATERGLFTDQKLFDLAPALFDGVRVLRHPGYNVATWNICERNVAFDVEQGPTVNGQPLRFCHFTKATHIGALALDKMLRERSFFEELFYSYVAQLKGRQLLLGGLSMRWQYGFYENGEAIGNDTRRRFRELGDSRWAVLDPYESVTEVARLLA